MGAFKVTSTTSAVPTEDFRADEIVSIKEEVEFDEDRASVTDTGIGFKPNEAAKLFSEHGILSARLEQMVSAGDGRGYGEQYDKDYDKHFCKHGYDKNFEKGPAI